MWDQATNSAVKVALSQPAETIAQVIKTQKDLGVALAGLDHPNPGDNPVTAFNELYTLVTEEVEKGLIAGTYQDGPFMEILDVEFARLYFQAIGHWVDGDVAKVKEAWKVLFKLEDKNGKRLSNLDGALLGVNAHINFDLTIALLEAVKKDPPGDMVARRADFDSINSIFDMLMDPITKDLINDLDSKLTQAIFNILDWVLGDLDEIITLALITEMRSQAWERAEFVWAGTGGPGGSFWDDLVDLFTDLLVGTGLFDRKVDGIEPALGRASAELLTGDLLRIEPRDGDLVLVTSAKRRIPGTWIGRGGDFADLITADWLVEAVDELGRTHPSRELEQLSADLQLIKDAHRPVTG